MRRKQDHPSRWSVLDTCSHLILWLLSCHPHLQPQWIISSAVGSFSAHNNTSSELILLLWQHSGDLGHAVIALFSYVFSFRPPKDTSLANIHSHQTWPWHQQVIFHRGMRARLWKPALDFSFFFCPCAALWVQLCCGQCRYDEVFNEF